MTRDRGGQAPLIHHHDRAGIWRKHLLDGGAVNAAPWLAALAAGELVGTCRHCGGYLKPSGQPYETGGVTWYPVACVGKAPSTGCGREAAAHGPRPAKKPPRSRAGP